MNAFHAVLGSAVPESGGVISRIAGEFRVQWSMLLAQALNFAVMALLLYRFALGPLLRVLDERKRTVEAGLASAAEADRRLAASGERCEAELQRASEEAQRLIAEAHSESKAQSLAERQRTERELALLRERELDRIREEQSTALRSARKELRKEAADLALRILQGGVDESTAAQLTASAVRTIGES
ncbi:MAG: ATP synthase F0 subunit B [Puniceicoccales bacterium]|jgi:F-type H+-transporting ATPase subunit b|nr:ATP synthase F0 subunit B [Puniceicoccales bacterium]